MSDDDKQIILRDEDGRPLVWRDVVGGRLALGWRDDFEDYAPILLALDAALAQQEGGAT